MHYVNCWIVDVNEFTGDEFNAYPCLDRCERMMVQVEQTDLVVFFPQHEKQLKHTGYVLKIKLRNRMDVIMQRSNIVSTLPCQRTPSVWICSTTSTSWPSEIIIMIIIITSDTVFEYECWDIFFCFFSIEHSEEKKHRTFNKQDRNEPIVFYTYPQRGWIVRIIDRLTFIAVVQ